MGDEFELLKPETDWGDSIPARLGISYNELILVSNALEVKGILKYSQLLNGKIVPLIRICQGKEEEVENPSRFIDGEPHWIYEIKWKDVKSEINLGQSNLSEINEEMIYGHIEILISEVMKYLNLE